MVEIDVDFLGTTVVDRLFSNAMVRWVVADIKRRKRVQKVLLISGNGEIMGKTDGVVIFCHKVQSIRFCEDSDTKTFVYLVRDEFEPVLNVYLFRFADDLDPGNLEGKMKSAPGFSTSDKFSNPNFVKSNSMATELFHSLRESVRDNPKVTQKSHSSAATLPSLCPDISPTNSKFFEVLYVGKMKVSHRKVPETFIDDALERIRLYELQKTKKASCQTSNEKGENVSKTFADGTAKTKCGNGRIADMAEPEKAIGKGVRKTTGNPGNDDVDDDTVADIRDSVEKEKCVSAEESRTGNPAAPEIDKNKSTVQSGAEESGKPEVKFARSRAGSLGVIETFKKKPEDGNQNRTMLFYVGKTDLRLISPDRKQVLLHKMLKEIICCIQGIQNSEHFGFISREKDDFVGYVFKCESNSVADHVVSTITTTTHQSNRETKDRSKQAVLSCEHCPMMWFHKLCAEVEEQNNKKTQLTILKKIESLPENEQMEIHTKFLGAETTDINEQNEFLMILLRTHCERKQARHIHDTEESRSEFLNQVLGGNTIFMKAKRSLTSSFDHLLKRKGSQIDPIQCKEAASRRSDSTINESSSHDEYHRSYLTVGPADGEIMKREITKHMNNKMQNVKRNQEENGNRAGNSGIRQKNFCQREVCDGVANKKPECTNRFSDDEADSSKIPLMNIFLKVGSSSKTSPSENSAFPEEMNQTPSGSWRQAIFNRVVSQGKTGETDRKTDERKTKQELRQLWKTAIHQQILLIRMEKENARLKARQEEVTVKRIKLEYDELKNCAKEQVGIWDMISCRDNRISSKCDSQVLLQAVRHGIPRARRGDAWYYFASQYCLKQPPFDYSDFPNYDVPYEDLLKQLTSFQHTILIDLGRTFPGHPYFSSPLGPGQLALFNLLKAYSLLDPQVGYCQGLSFVAGVLLLHVSEDVAFLLLKHLMFRKELRNQYLPNMSAIQVKLYQLSRLVHDTLPKLYFHFDQNEITPALYAASWMLTLFASQFPLGFVTRVFDFLYAETTTDVLFKVIMALLEEHSEKLLQLSSFEEIMNYFKNDIPKMDAVIVERIMKKVIAMDISKQLHEFEVEYNVLQEEISTPREDSDRLRKIEAENKKLKNQNLALQEQQETLTKNVSRLEKFRFDQQSTIRKLETKVKTLEITVQFLGEFISEMSEQHKDIDVPGDVRRIISNLESLQSRNIFDKSTFFRKTQSSIDFHEKPRISEFCTVNDLPNGIKFGEKSEKIGDQTKSNQNAVIKGIPLKVILDEDKYYHPSSNLTSKITSGVSSFFHSTNHQSNKNPKTLQENLTVSSAKSSDDTVEKSKLKNLNFSSEIGSLNIKESAIHCQKKENETKGERVISENEQPLPLEPFHNLDESSKETKNHLHPLDSSGEVNITFNGTTKLKSIKSGSQLSRNNAVDQIVLNNNILRITEDGES